ncbi:arylamine N-acetyltransferase [uncultured Metabacillus sp.]|uniref:arylamine N-acetyltransferase family protein n=1 Tax=uncultured Metabacillus sp. TaxID=2860135 RepID=UPI00261CF23E|nr:arylamine N-acetyltransferase [uncultured Metabacillus sp.]
MKHNQAEIKTEIHGYLNRIGYDGSVDPSSAVLESLQECHVHTVPYENFDILEKIPLSLEIQDLYDKIVIRRRGGYCFELNALFGWLLKELGYQVIDCFARFWRDEPNPPPMRRHHVLLVEAEGERYLCDVGVGGVAPRRPIKMIENLVQGQGSEFYKLKRDSTYGWILCEQRQGKWNWLYSISEEPQLAIDFITTSYWCENAPESIFTQAAMAAIRTNEGRNTIAGNEFRIFTEDDVRTFTPNTKKEYAEALRDYFGIVLNNMEKIN